jgi:hypothetical protein
VAADETLINKCIDPSTRVSRPEENGRGPPSLGMTNPRVQNAFVD